MYTSFKMEGNLSNTWEHNIEIFFHIFFRYARNVPALLLLNLSVWVLIWYANMGRLLSLDFLCIRSQKQMLDFAQFSRECTILTTKRLTHRHLHCPVYVWRIGYRWTRTSYLLEFCKSFWKKQKVLGDSKLLLWDHAYVLWNPGCFGYVLQRFWNISACSFEIPSYFGEIVLKIGKILSYFLELLQMFCEFLEEIFEILFHLCKSP